ncbi:HIG1 domain family member 1B isoform X1 [Rhinatrema bivittatum]|uniref:HIG1 domain family member 1B isoform X1 n=1 Tax=Rhinatrema bivittatum TaxID=194408 RepID=UPI0011286482|nr:HIG1 domain family member 1B isoform X1 [Rhinatrema bivittatum]XP_029429522.1 HIG1 domain family member 1B isoform X1 [Rhinatrema bivittatum]XP_029429523.1 HIG1 domain family member 1B isoform X1 [Rhinatrema bivittatum]
MSTDETKWVSETEHTALDKFQWKIKEFPLMPVGIAGFAIVVAYGLYRLKARGSMKMSVHLIHTRVAAQACVVGATALGATYTMYKEYVLKPADEKTKK